MRSRSCIPIRDGTIGCRPGTACSKAATSPRACHARAIASTFAILKSEFFNSSRFDSIGRSERGVEDYIRCDNNDRTPG
ncbi:IS3 family transposase [Rhizobium leguminosarum]|uniref:IS3 family transposase n=1 Tax=Rhizobium leguminosarum TaxID=384 RepID=UPI0032AFFF04